MKLEYGLINRNESIVKRKIDFIISLDNGKEIPYTLPESVSNDIYKKIGECVTSNDISEAIIKDVTMEQSSDITMEYGWREKPDYEPSEKRYCVTCGKKLDICDYIKNNKKDNWRYTACSPEHYIAHVTSTQKKFKAIVFCKNDEKFDWILYKFQFDEPIRCQKSEDREFYEYEHFEILRFKKAPVMNVRGHKCDLIIMDEDLKDECDWLDEFINGVAPCMLTQQRFCIGVQYI